MVRREDFERELSHAVGKMDAAYMVAAYWVGYKRGLRQSWEANYFTNKEHDYLSREYKSSNPYRAARGRGYRDGLAFGKEEKA